MLGERGALVLRMKYPVRDSFAGLFSVYFSMLITFRKGSTTVINDLYVKFKLKQ